MGLVHTPDMPPNDKPRTWGQWQKQERDRREWGQKELARASDVSERSIKRYEGGGAPSGKQVFLILSAFGFPVPEDQPMALNAEMAALRGEVAALTEQVETLAAAVAAFETIRRNRRDIQGEGGGEIRK